jgi:hypothetical protein
MPVLFPVVELAVKWQDVWINPGEEQPPEETLREEEIGEKESDTPL